MAQPDILTYYDAIARLRRLVGNTGSTQMEDVYEAIHAAYRIFPDEHDWLYYKTPGRVHFVATQTTGTIAYDHTGGTYERQLTLTGTTWPTTVADQYSILIDGVVSDIEAYKSSTVVTLDRFRNPGADVAASTTYTLFKSCYPLPNDFRKMGTPMTETDGEFGRYVSPEEWLSLERNWTGAGALDYHTIMAVPDLLEAMGLFVWRPPDAAETVDFVYDRFPRRLRYSGHDTDVDSKGTVSCTSGSATITGSGTAFSSDMIGSVIRIGSSTSNVPTAYSGRYPLVEERTITAVADTVTLTVDANVSNTLSGKKYCITDPVDMNRSMYEAFVRLAMRTLAFDRNLKEASQIDQMYLRSLRSAKAADEVSTQRRVAGGYRRLLPHWRDSSLQDDSE